MHGEGGSRVAASRHDLDQVIGRLAQALALAPAGHKDRARLLSASVTAYCLRFERDQAVADLDHAIDQQRQVIAAIPSGQPDRAGYLSSLGEMLRMRFVRTGGRDDLDEAIETGGEAVAATPSGAPDRARHLSNLGKAVKERFTRDGALADLDQAIGMHRAAVTAVTAGDPERAAYQSSLGAALLERFQRTGSAADLDEAIGCFASAAAAASIAGGARNARHAGNLGIALLTRFERYGVLTDLNEGIERMRETVTALPSGHPERPLHLSNLAAALRTRFTRTGVAEDLDQAVEVGRQAVAATPQGHPYLPRYLTNLGNCLANRFERTGAQPDLDEAIAVGRQSLAVSNAGPAERVRLMSNLAMALGARFDRTGGQADIDQAIDLLRQSVAATPADHPDRVIRLSNLGNVLRRRFGRTGALADLNEAIRSLDDAVAATPADHPDRVFRLSNLGIALGARFERTGVLADLGLAADLLREAVTATPADHPGRAIQLSNLGNALQNRFLRTGVLADLDLAVDLLREAVAITAVDHPDRAIRLSNLGNALRSSFGHTGAAADISDAVEAGRGAVAASPADHPDHSRYVSNLALALQARFLRSGAAADLDDAVGLLQDAVAAVPADHPGRARWLSNLGNALRARCDLAGAAAVPADLGLAADLDLAIERLGEAVAIARDDDPDRGSYLSGLGIAALSRFRRAGRLTDLDLAVTRHREAVAATPPGHASRATFLFCLGMALHDRYLRASAEAVHSAEGDLEEGISAVEQAAQDEAAPVSVRIAATREASGWVAGRAPGRAAGLLATAVGLLPRVAPRRLARTDQQRALGAFAGLAAEAATLTVRDPRAPAGERAARALGLLEAGRAVLMAQGLDTRSDLTDLAQRRPDLAEHFNRLRDLLDLPFATDPFATGPAAGEPGDPGHDGLRPSRPDRRLLAAEWDDLLARIRALDGFGSFLRPPSAAELTGQASEGPVIAFNVSRHGSDALLLTSGGISALPLPGLGFVPLTDQVTAFHEALRVTTSPHASQAAREAGERRLAGVLEWLWDNATGPVLDALGHRGRPSAGEDWPRVWWVPGGLLGLLPLHAAGYHRGAADPASPPGPGDRAVIERVVSSYTPTIRALGYARGNYARGSMAEPPGANRTDGADPEVTRALVVAMPTTPGINVPLTFALTEAREIGALLPGSLQLTGPTRDSVLSSLPECGIAHFACHGHSDPADPSRSRLLLQDHATAPLSVASLSGLYLDRPGLRRPRLAYLSACATAIPTGAGLADEAIHLASSFQLAGYQHVIGTLWEIEDYTAVTVATEFYTSLINGGSVPDIRRAPRALHHAVRAVRARHPETPSLWASYLHAGA